MAKTSTKVAVGTGGAGVLALCEGLIAEFHIQDDFIRRALVAAVPVVLLAGTWIGNEIWENIKLWRAERAATQSKNRLKQEFGPTMQCMIDYENYTREVWLQAKKDRASASHRRDCRQRFETARLQLMDYQQKGASLGISYYDSARTVAGPTPQMPELRLPAAISNSASQQPDDIAVGRPRIASSGSRDHKQKPAHNKPLEQQQPGRKGLADKVAAHNNEPERADLFGQPESAVDSRPRMIAPSPDDLILRQVRAPERKRGSRRLSK